MDLSFSKKTFEITSPYSFKGQFIETKDIYLVDAKIDTNKVFQVELTTYPGLIPGPNEKELELLFHVYKNGLEQFLDYLAKTPLENASLETYLQYPPITYVKDQLPRYWHYPFELLCLKILSLDERRCELTPLKKLPSSTMSGLITTIDQLKTLNPGHTQVWKIKCGRFPIEKELSLLLDFHLKLPQLQLRLDPNEMWGPEELNSFSKTLLAQPSLFDVIDYIESPTADPILWNAFHQKHPIPMALDLGNGTESTLEHARQWSGLEVLIAKPSLLSIIATSHSYSYSQQNNLGFVLSSCFESERGISDLMQLSNLFPSSRAQGLGTLCYLSEIPS